MLGYTRFGWNGPVEVVVSRTLSDEGSSTAERRVNSTLAHEAGHILLHSHLFATQPSSWSSNMFREEVEFSNKKILCKTDVVGLSSNAGGSAGYDGRWWEFQANKMIGALLYHARWLWPLWIICYLDQALLALGSWTPRNGRKLPDGWQKYST